MDHLSLRVFCTGNSNRNGVAAAVKLLWPNASFVSRSTGFDFLSWTSDLQSRFTELAVKHNVFINNSFISPGVQTLLLQQTHRTWMEHDIKGYIINIGTTLEWSLQPSAYAKSKLNLRQHSLELSDQAGITGIRTSHILVGGLNDIGSTSKDGVCPIDLVQTIAWIIGSNSRLPLLQIDSNK